MSIKTAIAEGDWVAIRSAWTVGAMIAIALMVWALRLEPLRPDPLPDDAAPGALPIASLSDQDARHFARAPRTKDDAPLLPVSDLTLGDPDPTVREEATLALGDRLDESSRAALESALLDSDAKVQSAAIRGLARIAGDSAAAALGPMLRHTQRRLRFEALDALGPMKNATAHALLTAASLDADPVMAEAAQEWLQERRRSTKNSN